MSGTVIRKASSGCAYFVESDEGHRFFVYSQSEYAPGARITFDVQAVHGTRPKFVFGSGNLRLGVAR